MKASTLGSWVALLTGLALPACSTPSTVVEAGSDSGTCLLTLTGAISKTQTCGAFAIQSDGSVDFGLNGVAANNDDLVIILNCENGSALTPGDYPLPGSWCSAYVSPLDVTRVWTAEHLTDGGGGGITLHIDSVRPSTSTGLSNLTIAGHADVTLNEKYAEAGPVSFSAVFSR